MSTCLDCGQPTSRGWTGGKRNDTRCLVCLTARLFARVGHTPASYRHRNATPAQRQQWYRQDRAWAARKRLRILRGGA